jgi:hypothetical protein
VTIKKKGTVVFQSIGQKILACGGFGALAIDAVSDAARTGQLSLVPPAILLALFALRCFMLGLYVDRDSIKIVNYLRTWRFSISEVDRVVVESTRWTNYEYVHVILFDGRRIRVSNMSVPPADLLARWHARYVSKAEQASRLISDARSMGNPSRTSNS